MDLEMLRTKCHRPSGIRRPTSVCGEEEIHDLDLYFIRQIAHNFQEYDLEQKIDLEIKMQEGTKKLLVACKHQTQCLEASKSLLTSNARMAIYMMELQRRKGIQRRPVIESIPEVYVEPSRAKVAVSDIRMPLIWKDSDHFKNKGDYRRFAVFCLLKVGKDVFDTVMANNVDRSMTDISFDDIIVFNHVPPDFEFRLEVYSHVLQEDLSIASSSNRLRKKLSSSMSKSIGKKLAISVKEKMNAGELGTTFDLVAHATLRLEDANSRIKTHDLVLENMEDRQHKLPLFGHFCCLLAVQPECMVEERTSGYLTLLKTPNNPSEFRRMWASLKNFRLCLWSKAEHSHTSQADIVIPVNKDTKVSAVPKPGCPRSFLIVNSNDEDVHEWQLAAETEKDCPNWIAHIGLHSEDNKKWGPVTSMKMRIPSPGPQRAVFAKARHSSLYEETPYSASDSPDSTSPCNSVFMDNIPQRLSSPSFRSRSSSTSSTSSSIGSSRQQFSLFRRSCRDLPLY